VTALNQAFRARTDKKHFCAIGSVKSNIGHLDNAGGAAGLIKVSLSLRHRQIPASLHFDNPNPKIDFENSPFFVNTELREWITDGTPRRAGVTSVGMGGTNAHVIVEEAPAPAPGPPGESRQWQLLMLSAKTSTALEEMTGNLLDYLKENPANPGNPGNPGLCLADAAYTLQVGRRDFNQRRVVLCQGVEDAQYALENLTPGLLFGSECEFVNRPVVFMFSGQGAQYVNMGKGLYESEAVFKENIDKCAEMLDPLLGVDLRHVIYPGKEGDIESNAEQLRQTGITQPVLFMIEYSVASMWMDWGIRPVAMIGHSIGELTAACIAGCMSLEDALEVVAARGGLMQGMEGGGMLSVGMGESDLLDMLRGNNDVCLSAVNSPKHCVVSGSVEAVEQLEKEFSRRSLFCRRLHTSHAFHSSMMDPIMAEFEAAVAKIRLNKPQIPFISGVTGTWIGDAEVVDPRYWARQLRNPVRFSDGIKEILKDSARILLEVGPGNSLCVLAKQHQENGNVPGEGIFSSLRHIKQSESDESFLLKTLGNLWLSGVIVDWQNYYKNERRHRIPLPLYPFERKRYWLEEVKETTPQIERDLEREPETEVETEAGKVEVEAKSKPRDAAAKTFQPRPALPTEYEAPGNEIEGSIVEIWEDILGIKPIGINDNFFDLGGHSLLATLFLSRLQEKYNVRLELRIIFESPTIATIARLVREEENKAGDLKEIESLLDEIEGLSRDEVQSALSDEGEMDREI
jgi:acyl transferase domain-containing protein